MFAQFAAVHVDLDSADTTVLVSNRLDTGLSIRGGLLWLIHAIDWYLAMDYSTSSCRQTAALSTVEGLATMPNLQDRGCIDKIQENFIITTAVAINIWYNPVRHGWLPPVPLAAPSINLYAQCTANIAALRGDEVACRIMFTTAPLDQAAYTEVAEVWGW
jgi:hypothetical protein